MANFVEGANYFANTDGFAPPNFGGSVACWYGTITYTDTTAVTLFTLPLGAVPVEYLINVTTAFTAGSGNTFDVGLGATGDNIANGAAAGSVAVLRAGSTLVSGLTLGVALEEPTAVTAVYIPSGTAADAGSLTVFVSFIMTNPL